MTNLLEYLVKSALALAVFYFFYWIFLRRDTHFMLNRLVLVASLILSLLLPFITLNLTATEPVIPALNISFDTQAPINTLTPVKVNSTRFSVWFIITVIYLTGAALVLIRLLYQAIYMQALSRLSITEKLSDFTLVHMNKDIVPFSYFNKIFIPVSLKGHVNLTSIIDHEKSHLKQYHFIDLFIVEFITVVQWFNPFAWFYEHSVKEIHEYLADRAVLDKGYRKGEYQALLVNQAMGGPVFTISNQFNKSLIKKRIVMMTKMKSPRLAQLKSFMLLPIIALLLMAYARPGDAIQLLAATENDNSISRTHNAESNFSIIPSGEKIRISGKVTHYDSGKPLDGAIVVIQGTTTGVATDKDGYYAILIPNDKAVLVFSHVGFKSQEIRVTGNTVINVMLEKEVVDIDFSKKNYLLPREKAAQTATVNEKDTYVVVEELPSYPGGTDALKKFIDDNLQYPADAKSKGVYGKVIVAFTITAEGKMADVKILRGIMPSIDEEALRVAKLTSGWKPGMQNGKPVATLVTMPITFILK